MFLRGITAVFYLFLAMGLTAQEVSFFTEGTDDTFYDEGIVDVDHLGESLFEYTHPPGAEQYNDKVPCSTTSHNGSTSLKFDYLSAENGNWKVTIYLEDWATADIAGMDSLSFYVFSGTGLPAAALPLIGLKANENSGSGDVESTLLPLSEHNGEIPAGEWTRVGIPLDLFFNDNQNSELDFTEVKGIIFNQSESDGSERLILVDDLFAFKSLDEVPSVENLTASGYDSHAELTWDRPLDDLSYQIYASFDGGNTYEWRGETSENFYLDFVPEEGRNRDVYYRVMASSSGKASAPAEITTNIRDFTDEELINMTQRYAFRYFWEGAHHPTGMILERSNGNGTTVASGATGMGLMTMIVAHEREYRSRDAVKDRVISILNFLQNCERHHGAWSHWYNADTYQTKPFTPDDDGGDIVETSYVAQALIALRNYFDGDDSQSARIREKATALWEGIGWDWYRNDQNVLYWHWSPNIGFEKGMEVKGWNESLITYIMAASSPDHAISKRVYDQGWARNGDMVNERTFYDYEISLAPDWGGPLFWLHYTHLGINPHGLEDQYANYWVEHVNTIKIHQAYAIDNPYYYENYGENCWGLTASDDPDGYTAHQPWNNDNGTISPTAALSSMPYLPAEVMKVLKYLYRERGDELWGKYGPYDAFNDERDWVQDAYIGIDQGPIVLMMENHRTGLLWKNVMKDPDVQEGLEKLGFQYQANAIFDGIARPKRLDIRPNPVQHDVTISLPEVNAYYPVVVEVYDASGKQVMNRELSVTGADFRVNCSGLENGLYFLKISNGSSHYVGKLMKKDPAR